MMSMKDTTIQTNRAMTPENSNIDAIGGVDMKVESMIATGRTGNQRSLLGGFLAATAIAALLLTRRRHLSGHYN